MKTKTQLVEEVMGILDSPEKWCKHTLWHKNPVNGQVSYCLLGAVGHARTGDATWWTMEFDDNLRAVLRTMDEVASEHGFEYEPHHRFFAAHADHCLGQVAVRFNNAPETEYEDLRLFLKEVLVRLEDS